MPSPEEVADAVTDTPDTRAPPLRLLIIEDSSDDAELMEHELRREGLRFLAERVESEPQLRASLARARPAVVLCDFHMPAMTCARALEILAGLRDPPPLIVVSMHIAEREAQEAIRQGARAVISKTKLRELAGAVRAVIRDGPG